MGAMTKQRDEGSAAVSPLAQAMAARALSVIGRVVVRSPVVDVDAEPDPPRPTHELVGRFGIRLRAPFVLLARRRRPALGRVTFHAEPGLLLAFAAAERTKRA